MQENRQSTASVRERGHQRYSFNTLNAGTMEVEPRRALAVFRALNLANNPHASRKLINFAGRDVHVQDGAMVISPVDCDALAARLRHAGYPLDDRGIRLFKMERGFSDAVRIGPDLADAYARFAEGVETRFNVTAEEWDALDDETRNAIQVLMIIGRKPQELAQVRAALGIRDSCRAPSGVVLVGRVSGERLVKWAHVHGWCMDADGLVRLAQARGARAAAIDENLAAFVSRSIRCEGEPTHDYSRVYRDGQVLNRRTVAMLKEAERLLEGGVSFGVVKGSYVSPEDKGAHPHLGGGTVDLSLEGACRELIEAAVAALRQVGFAAWYRDRGDGAHIHVVAIGDRELCPAAQWQVRAYFKGRDGRSRSDLDPHAQTGVCLPEWLAKYRAAIA